MEMIEYMVLSLYAGFAVLIPLLACKIINLDDLVNYYGGFAAVVLMLFFAIKYLTDKVENE